MEVGFKQVERQLAGHKFWAPYLAAAESPSSRVGMHVAIFSEPYLSLVLSGAKTIESRFSRVRCAPFGEVGSGDVILIKQVSGPIRGVVLARKAWNYKLTSDRLETLREQFGEGIKADEAFWDAQADAEYATLIELEHPAAMEPFEIDKRDRRGWVALHSNQTTLDFSCLS